MGNVIGMACFTSGAMLESAFSASLILGAVRVGGGNE